MHRNRSLDGGSRYKVCRTFSSSLKATAFKGSSQRSDMLRPTGPMSALMQFSLKSRLTANGPNPVKQPDLLNDRFPPQFQTLIRRGSGVRSCRSLSEKAGPHRTFFAPHVEQRRRASTEPICRDHFLRLQSKTNSVGSSTAIQPHCLQSIRRL